MLFKPKTNSVNYRLQYPEDIKDISQEQIAAAMIPDGSHNIDNEVTTFILRRNLKQKLYDEDIKLELVSIQI